jgi:hypothetical protein
MTISIIPDFLLLKFLKLVEIVEISVNFDHDHLIIKWYYGHGENCHFNHDYLENSKVSWSWSDLPHPPPLIQSAIYLHRDATYLP